jgi:hypothetical protein
MMVPVFVVILSATATSATAGGVFVDEHHIKPLSTGQVPLLDPGIQAHGTLPGVPAAAIHDHATTGLPRPVRAILQYNKQDGVETLNALFQDLEQPHNVDLNLQEAAQAHLRQQAQTARQPTSAPAPAPSVPSSTQLSAIIVIVAQGLLLFLSSCVILWIMLVGLRLQLFSPCWDHLHSPTWIGFIIALAFVGQWLGMLANHVLDSSPVHVSTWVCKCIQDECVVLIIFMYFLRLQHWQQQWHKLHPFASVYEKIATAPKLGECVPSTMLVSGLGALVLLLLNFPAAMALMWIGTKLWPNTKASQLVHGIDLVFPYIVLGLCAYVVLQAVSKLNPKFLAAKDLIRETWLCSILFTIGSVVQIVSDSEWLLRHSTGHRPSSVNSDKPIFAAGVIDVWCIVFHCNLVILLRFMYTNQLRCEPLPRPFEHDPEMTTVSKDELEPADSLLWAKSMSACYHSEVGPLTASLVLTPVPAPATTREDMDKWHDSFQLEFEDHSEIANDAIPLFEPTVHGKSSLQRHVEPQVGVDLREASKGYHVQDPGPAHE